MSEAWEVLARNYARYDVPLRPDHRTLAAVQPFVPGRDSLVVVLGATPIFADLAEQVWFVDLDQHALRQGPDRAGLLRIQKDWLAAGAEFSQADLIVGDGSLNALPSPAAARELLAVLAANLAPGARLAQRVFLRHELPGDEFQDRLTSAFEGNRFSAVRFLIYGVVAASDGLVRIADIDRFVAELERHLPRSPAAVDAYRAAYFDWRGLSVPAALAIETKAFFPTRAQMHALFEQADLAGSLVSPGDFPLAEFTPIHVVVR